MSLSRLRSCRLRVSDFFTRWVAAAAIRLAVPLAVLLFGLVYFAVLSPLTGGNKNTDNAITVALFLVFIAVMALRKVRH